MTDSDVVDLLEKRNSFRLLDQGGSISYFGHRVVCAEGDVHLFSGKMKDEFISAKIVLNILI